MESIQNRREDDLKRAENLLEQIKPNIKLESFDDATVEALKEAMELFEKWGVEEKMAEVFEHWGEYQSYKGDFSLAITYFQKSLKIQQQLNGETHELVARLYRQMGWCFLELSDFKKTEEYFNQSLRICEELFGKVHDQIIKSQNCLAGMHFRQAEYQKSLEYAYSNFHIAQKIGDLNPLEMANIYDKMATPSIMLGNFERGGYYLKMALDIYHQELPANHSDILTAYHNLSFAYSGTGDFNKAKLYIIKRIDSTDDKNSMSLVYSYHELGNIYHAQKNVQKAIGCAQKALKLIIKNNKENSNINNIVCRNLGIFYLSIKIPTEAFNYLNQSLKCCIKLFGQNHLETGRTNHYMGIYYNLINDFEQSESCFREAERIFMDNPNTRPRDLAQNWGKMSKLFYNCQKYLLAVQYEHKALAHVLGKNAVTDIYEHLPLPFKKKRYQIHVKYRFFLILLLGKAQSFFNYYWYKTKDIKDLHAAYQAYEQAFEFAEQIRKSFQSDQSKLIVIKEMQIEMDGAIRVGHALFDETQAPKYIQYIFNIFEKNKSYLLLETHQEKNAKQEMSISSVLLQKENDLKNQLVVLEKNIQTQEKKADKADKKLLKQFQSDYFNTYTQFETLQNQLETNYPDYYYQKYSTSTVSIEALQFSLQENQTVLNYFIGKTKIYLFAITADEYEIFSLEKPENLEGLIQKYLQSIKLHQKAKFHQFSFELYQ
ncbi:MAG: tetratricopeptide repeat protein, partial [Chitinophagales bacterium]